MSSRRCSRCGRTQQGDDDALSAAASELKAGSLPSGARYWPWASVEGLDVCPECQTSDEREDAARRMIAMIEAAMDRRSRESVPPEEAEPPLIAFAMAWREWLERQSVGYPEEEAHLGESHDLADLGEHRHARAEESTLSSLGSQEVTQLRVAITGAFVTGPSLDVRLRKYAALQSTLTHELQLAGWRVHDRSDRGTFESGGGFAKALPIVVARRDGAEALADVRDYLDDPGRATQAAIASAAPGFDFKPTHLTIDLYDLGVGVLAAWFEVAFPPGLPLPAAASAVKHVCLLRDSSPIASSLVQIARNTAKQYNAAIESAHRELKTQPPWPQGAVSDADQGRLLWLHPLHVVEAGRGHARIARDLAPVFRKFVTLTGGVFVPGIGWSAIVTDPGSANAAMPIRLTELHWAFFALYMVMDRGLMAVLNESRWTESRKLAELERSADTAFDVYLRVMEARARLDSELSALGGDELAVWRAIADVQGFDTIVDGVERKIQTLERLTQRRVDRADALRSRRVREILGSLTALTLITVAVALFGYFAGTKQGGKVEPGVRITVVAAALALAIAILWATFVGWPRPRTAQSGADRRRE